MAGNSGPGSKAAMVAVISTGRSRSASRRTASATTTAPSTSMPIAMAWPPRLIRLAVTPTLCIRMKVNKAVIASATITEARKSPQEQQQQNYNETTVVSSNAFSIMPTARPMRSERS